MIEYVEIGPVPSEEECAQVGGDDYSTRARRECRAFIAQIRRAYGVEPTGAVLRIRANQHEFGTYHEVAVSYDGTNDAMEYAFRVEADPEHKLARWDAEARQELGLDKPLSWDSVES